MNKQQQQQKAKLPSLFSSSSSSSSPPYSNADFFATTVTNFEPDELDDPSDDQLSSGGGCGDYALSGEQDEVFGKQEETSIKRRQSTPCSVVNWNSSVLKLPIPAIMERRRAPIENRHQSVTSVKPLKHVVRPKECDFVARPCRLRKANSDSAIYSVFNEIDDKPDNMKDAMKRLKSLKVK